MIKRRSLVAYAGCLVIGILGTLILLRSIDPVENRVRFTRSAAEVALERRMPSIELNGVPFDEAITLLGRRWGVDVIGDWPRLKTIGFDRRRKIYLQAGDISLEETIAETINQRKPDVPKVTYTIIDGRIVVTDAATLGMSMVRVYDIQDLCRRPDLMPGSKPLIFDGPEPGPESPADSIRELIVETIDPDCWSVAGGTGGVAKTLGTRLIIAQSFQGHIAVRNLLAQLRAPSRPGSAELPLSPRKITNLQIWDERVKRWFSPDPSDSIRLLRTHLGRIQMNNLPLDQAVALIADKSKAPIYLDRDTLPEIGVKALSIDLPDPTLADVLRLLVRVDAHGQLGFYLDAGGVIIITNRGSEVPPPVITQTYDLREWLATLGYSKYSDYAISLTGGSPATAPSPRGLSRDDAIEELIKMVTTQIDPDSWRDAGGTVGSIRPFNGILIVTQTYDNQEEIAKLFEAIQADPKWLLKNRPATEPGDGN